MNEPTELTPLQERALELVRREPRTIQQVAQTLKRSPASMRSVLFALKTKGLVAMERGRSPGRWSAL